MRSDGKRRMKSLALAAVLCLSAVLCTEAACGTGQGDGAGSFNFETAEKASVDAAAVSSETVQAAPGQENVNSSPTTERDTGTGAKKETVNGTTCYIFDGKRYVVDQDWGSHYLTGFSSLATGGIRTRSGKDATSDYTAASTTGNLGKVILIEAETGPSGGNIHRYDGVYKCEDTGGEAVEYGTWKTGGIPVVDLFFDTEEQADQVSGNGWITARIYVLKEVE